MISIATNERELVLIYNSSIKNHREIYAYAKSADAELNALDVTQEKITGTLYSEVSDLMGMEVKDLIPTDHAAFIQKHGENVSLENNGAIKILQSEPDMLIFPIVVRGKKAIVAHLYSDVTKLFQADTDAVNIP